MLGFHVFPNLPAATSQVAASEMLIPSTHALEESSYVAVDANDALAEAAFAKLDIF